MTVNSKQLERGVERNEPGGKFVRKADPLLNFKQLERGVERNEPGGKFVRKAGPLSQESVHKQQLLKRQQRPSGESN